MDGKVMKKTQDTLGKIIKKPPLTEKLLSKPPFRFLHDVMTSLIKTTGFMKGLFTESELNSENVKEKESKMAFLQKVIDFTSSVTGKSVSAKPSKIVAGHEPEQTNALLQSLAAAVNMKGDYDAQVSKFLNKGSKEEPAKEKSKDREEKRRKEPEEKRDREKSRDRERGREKEEKKEKDDRKDKSRDRDERHKDREDRHREKDDRHNKDREERHRDRDDRHKDRDRRKKVIEIPDPDTLAEFLCADDQSDGDTDSDMDLLATLSDMDIPNQLQSSNLKNKNIETIQNVSVNASPKVEEVTKTPRTSRPGAARPRVNRRPDVSYSNEIVHKSQDMEHREMARQPNIEHLEMAQRTQDTEHHEIEKMDDEKPLDNRFMDTEGKKRKSGTKSRMAIREKQKEEAMKVIRGKNSSSKINPKPESGKSPKSSPGKKTSSKDFVVLDSRSKFSKRLHKSRAAKQPIVTKSSPSRSKRHKDNVSPGSSTPGQENSSHISHRQEDQVYQVDPYSVQDIKRTRLQHRDDDDEGKENEGMVNGEKQESEVQRPVRPSSAKGSRRRRDEDEQHQRAPTQKAPPPSEPMGEDDQSPQVSASKKLNRPSSARPAPPRRKQETIENEPAMRLGSGKPANVIVDGGDSDDDENFLVEESAPPPPEPDQTISRPEDSDEDDHGGLVKKILETKKELEGGSQQQQQTRKTEVERPTMSDGQRRKQREMVQKEIDRLRGSIQTLTRSANPLGKIMDYVQEDLDSMQKELERWKTENKEHILALKREKAITDKAIEPMKAQLGEVDQAIADQMDLIAAVKSNIIRNDQKIEKLLRSIAKS
ncbi:TRAF3-interacting protein 1-like isoform X2 [Mizuhopecten yessoensis]|uniref:TRAF3-interacting protein 1-like isoform X2 n=1 Tax=Mizuhopecten yessoensis TaxID=6573 RepID=UPI000B45764D|nr:TRAF3-interacting protein 1-like isoform X2 [Mizuhopecten yessoensis]